jgi:hypothetical protein
VDAVSGFHDGAFFVSCDDIFAARDGRNWWNRMLTFTKCFGTTFFGAPRTHLHNQPTDVLYGIFFIVLIFVWTIFTFI